MRKTAAGIMGYDGTLGENLRDATRGVELYKALQQYTYTPDKIDTSIGDNGYSRNIPGFAFYKDEPKILRDERIRKVIEENQRKSDEFFRSRHPFSERAKDMAVDTGKVVVDALNRGVHFPVSALRSMKNGILDLTELAARAPGGFGLWKDYDRAVTKGFTEGNRLLDKYTFNLVNDWLDRKMFNQSTIRPVGHVEKLTDAWAQLWALGKIGGKISKGPMGFAASNNVPTKLKPVANALEAYARLRMAPREFNEAANNIRARRFSRAAVHALSGTALADFPFLPKVLRARQAAVALKHPWLAKIMGTALAPVRYPAIPAVGAGVVDAAMSGPKSGPVSNPPASGYVDEGTAGSDRQHNANILKALGLLGVTGLGGYGIYRLLKRNKKKDEPGDEPNKAEDREEE